MALAEHYLMALGVLQVHKSLGRPLEGDIESNDRIPKVQARIEIVYVQL
jgi:hypothetical protein